MNRLIGLGILGLALSSPTVLAAAQANPTQATQVKMTNTAVTQPATATQSTKPQPGLLEQPAVTESVQKTPPQQQTVPAQQMVTAAQDAPSNQTAPNINHTNAPVDQPTVANTINNKYFSNSRVKINGFFSAGVSSLNSSVPYDIPYYGSVKDKADFEPNTLIGLQFSARLIQNLSVVLQVVGDGDNINGNKPFQVQADWAYLNYSIGNVFQSKLGRYRIPAFLYSETQEIGYTYPWVFLPNEIYSVVPFNNINGLEVAYRFPIGGGWSTTLEPYVGSGSSQYDTYAVQSPRPLQSIAPGATADFNEHSLMGGVIKVGNQYITLRGTYAHVRVDADFDFPAIGKVQVVEGEPASYWEGGMKVAWHGLILNGEFATRNNPAPVASLQGYYGMIGFRTHGFLPYFTFGHLKTTNTDALATPGSQLPQAQESYSGGLDYYISKNFVSKVEVSDIIPLDGTRGLFETVNPATVQGHHWLYTVSLDAVF